MRKRLIMANNNNLKNRVKFGDGQDPTRGGRPRKIYNILKDYGYSKDDITTCFSELAWYTMPELEKLKNDDSNPIILKIVSNQFLKAFSKGDWGMVKDILEHVIGRPKQDLGITETIIKGITLD